MRRGLIIILSSPSGAGKSTLSDRLRAWDEDIVLNLPNEAKQLWNGGNSIQKKHAINFCYKRGLSDSDIIKYNLHYCLSGIYQNRIIIPSYDSDGQLNYL